MNILIIGPFPLPVHGCSLANQVLRRQLASHKDVRIDTIDTNSVNVSSKQVGSFSITKIVSFLKVYNKLGMVKKAEVVYSTPGQTFFGIAKYIPFYWLCTRMNIPYIIHVHGNHLGNEYKMLKGIKKRIFSKYISGAAAGIVLSRSLRDNFDGLLPEEKIHVAENFALNEVIAEIDIKKPVDKLRLLFLGNLMKEKGILDFLDCLVLLNKKGIEFKADIAGKIEDESQEIVSSRLDQLKDYITYHGVVHGKEKVSLLENANVFILPTYYKMEGQPISIIEAMASGNIIVTTRYSGIPDIVGDQNGFFVKPKAPDSILQVLETIESNLESHVTTISKRNVEYVRSNFTEEQFGNKIMTVINSTLKK